MAESPAAAHGTSGRQHLLVGDVHLVLINRAGEVLFRQRRNTGHEDDTWHLPSGHLQAGESVVAALIRVAGEAIGVRVDEQAVTFCHVMHQSSDGGRVAFFFAVHHWADEPTNLASDTCGELRWFSLGALPYDLTPHCRTALEWIAANHCFSVYGW